MHAKFGFDLNLTKPDEIAMWAAPGFRDQKFAEGAAAVAGVVASIDADIIVLTEVGDQRDVEELKSAIAARGVTYPHTAVCACTDTFTQQLHTAARRGALEGPAVSRTYPFPPLSSVGAHWFDHNSVSIPRSSNGAMGDQTMCAPEL